MPADRASLVACAHLPRPDQHTSALPQYRSSVASVRTAAFIVRAPLPPASAFATRHCAGPGRSALERTIACRRIPMWQLVVANAYDRWASVSQAAGPELG